MILSAECKQLTTHPEVRLLRLLAKNPFHICVSLAWHALVDMKSCESTASAIENRFRFLHSGSFLKIIIGLSMTGLN